jgi:hypothetical protein
MLPRQYGLSRLRPGVDSLMRADELVVLASAHGIDLTHVAGAASNTRGAASKRSLTREERRKRMEEHLGLEIEPSVRGNGSRTYRRPQWSLAEIGQAAEGVPELPWLAACYSWGGDSSCYWTLWWGLSYQAQRLGRREGWQPRVMGRAPRDPKTGKPIVGAKGEPRFYLLELAQMVLDEDAHKWAFAAWPGLHAAYLQVEDATWARILAPRYEMLQGKYESWLATAKTLIQRKLAEEAEETESAQ